MSQFTYTELINPLIEDMSGNLSFYIQLICDSAFRDDLSGVWRLDVDSSW